MQGAVQGAAQGAVQTAVAKSGKVAVQGAVHGLDSGEVWQRCCAVGAWCSAGRPH